jgi:hypothetical protein
MAVVQLKSFLRCGNSSLVPAAIFVRRCRTEAPNRSMVSKPLPRLPSGSAKDHRHGLGGLGKANDPNKPASLHAHCPSGLVPTACQCSALIRNLLKSSTIRDGDRCSLDTHPTRSLPFIQTFVDALSCRWCRGDIDRSISPMAPRHRA